MTLSLQSLLPQHLISQCAGKLAESPHPLLKNWLIKLFIKHYQVDLSEALLEKPESYLSFNEFFTRQLKPNVRTISPGVNDIVSPVDGAIAQIGQANKDQLLQAKNFYFDLKSLLANDEVLANNFHDGLFATLYLAPHNYHRVHMPLDGHLVKTIYVPGKLFSVNGMTANSIPNLYSRNERLICIFETRAGLVALIFVGAIIVGSIKPVWLDEPQRNKNVMIQEFAQPIKFTKGEELGYFKLGSTVILLFIKNKIKWSTNSKPENLVQIGELLGSIV